MLLPPHHVERPCADAESDAPDAELVSVAGLAVDFAVGRVVHGEGVEVAAARGAREAPLVPRLQKKEGKCCEIHAQRRYPTEIKISHFFREGFPKENPYFKTRS